jgi:hypothetical protein
MIFTCFPCLFGSLNSDLPVQIFFNTVPFQGKYEYQIMRLVTSGGRPRRLESPRMDNSTWTIIQSCWRNNPVLRPAIEDIRTQMQLTAA